MHTIDGDGNAGGNFVDGNPSIGQRATVVTPAWLNAVQQEIINVIQAAGLGLNKLDNSQLIQALGIVILQQLDLRGVWRSTNDGAGSGMDTDLFHGLGPGYFTDIPARLGYTPLNQTSYTTADVLAKMLTVDGAGSGIDADRFHGQAPGYFTDIIARLGYTPANAAHFGFNANTIGHYLLPGGFAINWGTSGVLASDGQQDINLSQPVSMHLAAVCVPNGSNANVDNHGVMVNQPIGLPATELTVGRGFITGGGGASGTVTFIALGKV